MSNKQAELGADDLQFSSVTTAADEDRRHGRVPSTLDRDPLDCIRASVGQCCLW